MHKATVGSEAWAGLENLAMTSDISRMKSDHKIHTTVFRVQIMSKNSSNFFYIKPFFFSVFKLNYHYINFCQVRIDINQVDTFLLSLANFRSFALHFKVYHSF